MIIGVTGGIFPSPGDFERALDLWCYKAEKAGWKVTVLSRDADSSGEGRCGTVEVEGLRYEIRYGPRTRVTAYDDTTGEVVPRPVFEFAVWAEPVILERFVPADTHHQGGVS